MRQFFAKLLIGLIVLTGVLPLLPHNDFGNAAHAHSIVSMDSTSTPASLPVDQSRSHPIVDCNTVNHVFVTVVSAASVLPNDENISFPDYSPRASSRVVAPALPPPNS